MTPRRLTLLEFMSYLGDFCLRFVSFAGEDGAAAIGTRMRGICLVIVQIKTYRLLEVFMRGVGRPIPNMPWRSDL